MNYFSINLKMFFNKELLNLLLLFIILFQRINMTTISSNYLKGFSVLFVSLLAACNSDDKNTTNNAFNQKLVDGTISSLQTLSQNLVWQENQCDSVYSR